eukprot:m.151366 g.151366  ORF g.151366 m.151366 type:complete len:57 (-) comp14248_c0_seq9:2836-3006(-)
MTTLTNFVVSVVERQAQDFTCKSKLKSRSSQSRLAVFYGRVLEHDTFECSPTFHRA